MMASWEKNPQHTEPNLMDGRYQVIMLSHSQAKRHASISFISGRNSAMLSASSLKHNLQRHLQYSQFGIKDKNLPVTGFVQVWELFYKTSRSQALFRYENRSTKPPGHRLCSGMRIVLQNLPVTGFVQVWELFYKTSRSQALFRYENCSTKSPGHRLCSGMRIVLQNLPVTGFVQVWELF